MYKKRQNRLQTIEQMLLSDPNGHTVGDLSERFGVTERMIFLDISHLRSNGSPIIGIPGPGGGVTIEEPRSSTRETRSETRESIEIFGYTEERQRLSELLRSTSDGSASTAIVLGEMGAGKSFTTRELILQAERIGFSILTGNSLERSDSPPYWPWSSILDGLSGTRVPRAAASQFDRSIKILEQAFPIAARSKRVRSSLSGAFSRTDQLQLHEACRLVLETAASLNPILIVIEDIQWADERSLELIHHLMQSIDSLPVLMIMTVRTPVEEPAGASAKSLSKVLSSTRGTTITLDSLKKHEAAQIMQSVLKSSPPDSAITAAYDLSGGNPFFMREISLLLNHRYDLDSIEPGQQLDIPVSVKLAVEERLRIVDPVVVPALQLASVIGREVDQQELISASENLSLVESATVVQRVVESGILGNNDQTGRLWFTHKLIRQTIYDSIESSQLPTYHSAVANAIEQQSGGRANQQPSDLARHFWISRPIDGLAKYAHYGVLTALEQMAALTPDDVISQFESILEIPTDQIDPHDRALALFGLGKCLWLQSAGNATRFKANIADTFIAAYEGFLESDDVESALMVAAHTSHDLLDPKTRLLLNSADQISDESTRDGTRIKLAMALAGYFSEEARNDTDSPTLRELSRILYLARRNQDVELEKEILSNDARIRVDLLDLEASIDRALHHFAISDAQDQFADITDPHFQASRAYATLGDLPLAKAHAPKFSRISTSIEHNILSSQWHAISWSLAICAGDWEAAGDLLPGMRQWAEDSNITEGSVGNSIRILEAYLESMTSISSELDESWYSLIELSSLPLPSTSDPAQIKAVIALRTGANLPMDLARNGLLLPPATNLNTAVRHMGPFHRLARNCALGIHAAATGDIDSAKSLYQQMSQYSGIFGGILSAPLAVDRVLGLLARTLGQYEQALEHLVSAANTAENAGFKPEHAQSLFDQAQLLLADNTPVNLETAYGLLERSQELASSIQISALVADCEEALTSIDAPTPSTQLGRYGLTSREEDVLKLIAEGLRNQEIAEQLFISINTVQHHVRNILRKTGAKNRTGASTLVAVN
ncbi:MAG: AAA family ATPase [Chloroflexi bacterium]|jgi:DNA-binding CsgD family transcriptional regulator|nr:AAA family ATPase [Chloroflexota bacterium]